MVVNYSELNYPRKATAMFSELVNRGSSGKLYTWQSNILLPYGSWNSPSLHPGPWPSRCGQTRSTAARYVTWTSDVFSPRGISRNGCTCSFHSCHEFRVVLPTCIWQYNSYVSPERMGRKRRKGNGKAGSGWAVTNLEDIFWTKNYMSRLRITYNEQTWMFTCINVKTLGEFFLCPVGRDGGGW